MTLDPDSERPILLLGAAGQVGAALAPRLAVLGRVVCALRADADLERPDELRALVRRAKPRLLINAAAYTAVDQAEGDAERCGRVNAEAPGALAEAASLLGAPIVHFSTNYVFDGRSTDPYREDDPVSPLNVYGATKALGEQAVAAANPAHLIFRTAGVYGWTGRNFMLRILALAGEREELQVVDDQLVAPTPASSVADAAVTALGRVLRSDEGDGLFGTYHLTASGATSWFGFAERILTLQSARAGQRLARLRSVSSDELPAVARRPLNGILNTDKLRHRLGVTLPDWETALRHTCAEYANRPREAR